MTTFEPWQKPLRERLGVLSSETHRVAYFAPKPDSGSFRYRCYNMAQAINEHSSSLSASYFFLSDLAHIRDLSEFADTLVVFRTPYDTDIHRLITQFVRKGKRVLFDIDDLVFDTAYAPLVTSNLNYKLWGKDIDQWFAFIANIGACMKLCDEVITTNPFLQEKALEYSGLPVSVIPNFFNNEQLEASRTPEAVKELPSRSEGLQLGYFSGSQSHAKDFAVASAEIANFLTSSPHSSLTVIGHLDIPPELSNLQAQISHKPFLSFVDLQSAVAQVDVNLVPLQMSPFTFSKSELKYFEAALVKTLTLASPTPLFSKVIRDNLTGFLAPAGQWHRKLREIEELSMARRNKIATAAYDHTLADYSPGAIASRLEKLLNPRN